MAVTTGIIEVTPEMVEAGFQVLARSGLADVLEGADRLLVEEIYRAMFEASIVVTQPVLPPVPQGGGRWNGEGWDALNPPPIPGVTELRERIKRRQDGEVDTPAIVEGKP